MATMRVELGEAALEDGAALRDGGQAGGDASAEFLGDWQAPQM